MFYHIEERHRKGRQGILQRITCGKSNKNYSTAHQSLWTSEIETPLKKAPMAKAHNDDFLFFCDA